MKIFLITLMFFLISGCSTNTSSPESLTQASIPKVEKQVVQKGVFLIADCKKDDPRDDNDCLCETDINYPVVSGLGSEAAQIEINKKFKKLSEDKNSENKNEFWDLCEGKLINTAEKHANYSVSQNYEVTINSPDILAIKFQIDYERGYAQPGNAYQGFIIDVKTSKELSAKDIFGENIAQVNQVIYDKLLPIAVPDEIEKRKGKFIVGDDCDSCNLFLSKEGMKIVFVRGVVAGSVAGNPEILIPNKYIVYPAIVNYFK